MVQRVMKIGEKIQLNSLMTAEMSKVFAGALLGAIAAATMGAVSAGHSWQADAPLAFIFILIAIAEIFGSSAGFAGTLLSALVLALLLHPEATVAARANIAWMVLIGVLFSFFFAPRAAVFHRPRRLR
ncbi:MAG TPA: hypothetical protein VKT33_00990 [Candidatus Angelobacter sp.]|nr:hypothetical protein [Candidatus Angelobacter sp.]